MKFLEVGSFEVLHKHLAWPWVAVNVSRSHFAFAAAEDRIATRSFIEGDLAEGTVFQLPNDLRLPPEKRPDTGHRGAEAGIHAFSIDVSGVHLAVTATVDGASVVVTLDAKGEQKRSRVDALIGADFVAHAVAFDRTGARLWISAESGTETALLVVDAYTHAVFASSKAIRFRRRPFTSCTCIRKTTRCCSSPLADKTERSRALRDGRMVHPRRFQTPSKKARFQLVSWAFHRTARACISLEADELRTHAWPGLEELSSVDLADDFASSYAGVVMGDRIFVDGEDRDTGDGDAVMLFDRAAIRGVVVAPPVPTGMWVGRLGIDANRHRRREG